MFIKRIPQILTALVVLVTLAPAAVVERTATARKGVKDDPNVTNIEMRMPPTHPNTDDNYVCTYVQVPKTQTRQYIIQYKPHADENTVHHMLLFGCARPEKMDKKWSCRGACAGKSVIMYAWPKHAPPLVLPDGVGFAVGGETNIDYLVLQIHYASKFTAQQKADTSGMDIQLTSVVQPYVAGIYLLYSVYDNIPPRTYNYDIPVSCQFKADIGEIHPFAFRPHAHDLATSITGYLKNATSTYVIGQGDPQLPQAFYPIEQQITIKPNDYVAAICSYNSMSRNTGTSIGSHHTDEMCNFYMMFYTKNTPKAKSYYQCTGNNYPGFVKKLPLVKAPEHVMKKQEVEFVHDWPSKDAQKKLNLGQVSGVTTTPDGHVLIFQRGSRSWGGTTFNADETLTKDNLTPIKQDTIIKFDKNGEILDQWGANFFYMPHGIHMDKKGNLWMTDVGRHQVFRFDAGEKVKPALVLGEFLKPGKDEKHFCKPSDVAVLDNGDFFVTDGYCNTRVMRFNHKGKLLTKWGNPSLGIKVPPANAFYIPHSITLVEDHKEVCVADRENGRVQCFDYDGKFLRKLKPKEIGNRLFAITYSPKAGGVLYAVNGPDFYDPKQPVAGFTMKLETGQVLETWEPSTKTIKSLANPHDVAVSPDGSSIYVAEIGPNKIWKFRVNDVSKDEISYRKLLPNKTKKITEPAARISDEHGRKAVDSGDDLAGGDMTASMIIGALLIVPIIVIIIVTVIIRLRKSGKLRFNNKNYKNRKNKLNLGSFFGRHKGFDQLSQDESDHELDHLSDSEVEEYTASTQKGQMTSDNKF